MNKTFIAILAIIILGFGGLVTWSFLNSQSTDYASFDSTRPIGPDPANGNIGDHFRGNPDAAVVIVEWGDFSCGHCAQSNPMFKRIADAYGDKIAWVYRHFPLTNYPNSLSAATAVEAAGLQGYFWEMLDAVFANQALWYNASETARTDLYVDIFKRAVPEGDADQLRSDMSSRDISKKIDFDKNLGKLNNLKGTPTLFHAGHQIDGSVWSDESLFRSFINDRLKEAGYDPGTLPEGTASEE